MSCLLKAKQEEAISIKYKTEKSRTR